MPAKPDTARRCADLLAALARTANVRLSLKETGVSAGWAYARRRADADFDARWRTAVRAGRRELGKEAAARAADPAAASTPALAARNAGLVFAGSLGRGTLRLERAGRFAFTERRRAAFLDALRATCNVKAAARATGVSPTGAYRHYHRDAAFRAGWEAALAEGRMHLEMAMMGAARALFECPPLGPAESMTGPNLPPASSETSGGRSTQSCPPAGGDGAIAPISSSDITGMDARVALQLLRLHAPQDARGRPRGPGRFVKPADPDETRREILAKVAAIKAARLRDAGGEAVTGVNPVTSVGPCGPPAGIRALDRNGVAGVALMP